ncbi:MAG: undecaprenyl-diphosphate phosphatase [Methylophilaceae bacterium]|nr:undecaprenyl-diphosphate phosphatase [Methylophilaceae bacterium]
MDNYLIFVALILGVVEGATEFLPISSTGHLIIVSDLLNFDNSSHEVFEIVIQLGAIVAVVIEYRKKLTATLLGVTHEKSAQDFLINLVIAFIPAAILGLMFHNQIKLYLFNPVTVSIALIVGGIAMIIIEKKMPKNVPLTNTIKKSQALTIGLAQCLALVPGISRAASTIMGGVISGLDRKTATEFSFYLAIPIIFAASMFDLTINWNILTIQDLPIFITGFIAAFFSARIVIKIFIKYVANHTFVAFGWYRIFVGFVTLYYFY